MSGKPQKCPMRHENGNCVPCGGFCLAVQPLICEALQNAFDMGMRDGISVTMRAKSLVVQKHGRWEEWWPGISVIMTGEEMLYNCSNCSAKYADIENKNYCPNCGAKMDGET